MAVSLTLATTDGRLGGLEGLAFHVTDADGTTRTATLDDDGHALVLLTTDSYRLAVEAPVGAVPAVTPTIELSQPLPVPARATVGAGRRARRRPAHRRPALSPAAALWALTAAVVLLFAMTLVPGRDTPAGAVDVVELKDCTPDAATRGAEDGKHVEVVATWVSAVTEAVHAVVLLAVWGIAAIVVASLFLHRRDLS